MPIGKDSIKKRVAKVAETEAPVTEEKAVEAKTAAKKPTTAKAPAKKAATTATAKAPATKKPATKKAAATEATLKVETPAEPATAVMGNVAPETVEKVVGHAEGADVAHVQIGQKMPTHLL